MKFPKQRCFGNFCLHSKRINYLERTLSDIALQLETDMLLCEYKSKGYKYFRTVTHGENCGDCNGKAGKITLIEDAVTGETKPPFHPNCDCSIEVLDDDGNVAHLIESKDNIKEENLILKYWWIPSFENTNTSDKNINVLDIISNFLAVASLIPGLDTFTDLASIPVDLLRKVWISAGLDLAGAIPFVGEIADTANIARKADKAIDTAKAVNKMTAKEALEVAKKLGFESTGQYSHGQPIFKKGNRYITPDADSHNGGVWKMADSIKNLKSKKTRMGTYDANLNKIGE